MTLLYNTGLVSKAHNFITVFDYDDQTCMVEPPDMSISYTVFVQSTSRIMRLKEGTTFLSV